MTQIMSVLMEEVHYAAAVMKFRLSNGRNHQSAKVLVNGSPKSGTTWMLKLIASLPGYNGVGNFDRQIKKYRTVLPGDVVHGHDWYTPELAQILTQEGIRVILMLRDPRDQLISRMFHVKRSTQHAWHERMKPMSNDEALMQCIIGGKGLPSTDTMIRLAQTWIDNEADILCVRYEDMLAEPVQNFRKVLSYLGIENAHYLAEVIVERNRFERLSVGRRIWQSGRKPGEAKHDSHFRKGIAGDWKNHLNADHIERFKEIAGQQLIDLGYEKDFEW